MNIQTLPQGGDGLSVKAAFVPKLDAFLLADYPNIELKLLAFYLESINWPSMAEVFRNGADLHYETASGVFAKPVDQITKAERQVGKKLNFSIVYGGGVPTLIKQLAVTAPEALEMLHAFHSTWPGIGWESRRRPADPGTLIDYIKMRVNDRGYITTLYGRHLHPKAMHAALNNLCQGCAADLAKWAMVRTHEGLLSLQYQSHIVNMIHDQLILDCSQHELHWVASALPDWMTDHRIDSVVPIRPQCEVSTTNLSETRPYGG